MELDALNPPEVSRTYDFGAWTVYLENVTHLLVRDSGTHRLRTADGNLHIIPTGWIHIEIDAKEFQQ